MVTYSGITNDLSRRRQEHESERGPIKNWHVANNGQPFPSRDAAQKWESAQPGEHHPGGAPASGPWFGYSFEYDRKVSFSDLKLPK